MTNLENKSPSPKQLIQLRGLKKIKPCTDELES